MLVQVHLIDINPTVIKEFRRAFDNYPEVTIHEGSMLDLEVSAWVSPTNSRGVMDGGLDAAIKNKIGPQVEKGLQKTIKDQHKGILPLGYAAVTEVGQFNPRYVISTPSMVSHSEDVSNTLNTAMACAAAFQAVNMQNEKEPGTIRSVALPGLGAGTGRVPPNICADLMWAGFSLFRRRRFDSFQEMNEALVEELGQLGPASATMQIPQITIPEAPDHTSEGEFIPGSIGHVKEDVGF